MENEKPKKTASERYEEYKQKLQQMRLIDDTFMTQVFNNIQAMELLLKIIFNDKDLSVVDVETQAVIENFAGHSVRMDSKSEDKKQQLYNVEVQRSDGGANPKRARFNSGALNAIALPKGEDYKKLPDTYVIFITESDVLEGGLPLYHIDRYVRETGRPFNDGGHIIYVNSEIQDDTPLGRLMHDFYCENPEDMYYKELRNRANYFKHTEEGVKRMCEIMEKIADESREEGRMEGLAKGRTEGRAEGNAAALLGLVNDKILSEEDAAKRFGGTFEELKKAASYLNNN